LFGDEDEDKTKVDVTKAKKVLGLKRLASPKFPKNNSQKRGSSARMKAI
jgi:hypothetical protein